MNAEDFAAIFDAEVRDPLVDAGFTPANKSLFLSDGFACLGLIRLGGRLAIPGHISHILCFRHTFLRSLEETVPRGFVSEVYAYPYKLRFADFAPAHEPPRYRPRNLNYDYDRFRFDGIPVGTLRLQLHEIRSAILDRVLPWARSIIPSRAYDEIRDHGEDAWIERIWLEDYSAHLSNEAGDAKRTGASFGAEPQS